MALALLFTVAVSPVAQAQTFTVLHSFSAVPDGANPNGPVIDVGGNLYGTTTEGGAGVTSGTVFRVSGNGSETVVYSFTGGADGANPYAGLVHDSLNNGYGTTQNGGSFTSGTIFKLDSRGHKTVLHNFAFGEGMFPDTALVLDPAGNLYGTAPDGGNSALGTAYKLDTNGTLTVLHSFAGATDGANPLGPLVRDGAGNLYGTTEFGGFSIGYGTVFKIDANGHETVLYSFTGGADGANPVAGLALDPAGNLYGTTEFGGAACNCGVVFRLDKTGKETVLYSFAGGSADGAHPVAGVTLNLSKKRLYGTTYIGGPSGRGVVFEIDGNGQEKVLHSFTGSAIDGGHPLAGLAIDAQGNLFGTTIDGGAFTFGTVFKLTP
jgi:uncharacterized repeat protein (TIGR03803 family)